MYSKQTIILNETGLHARPASQFVELAKSFASSITIRKAGTDRKAVNAKSIVLLLAEGCNQGALVEIAADGPDEQAAVEGLAALIDGRFGEA